ncbi:hypothetical protein [Marivivens sp. JLT3646]|uniref:hypothetical protein n=1 Tax=Marivivens sp. JLT3646 TaxID=1920883 RepID=UPI0008014E4E|nr:hypothetical protein [Marivivens sp. JLT3646]APO86570.1 hypothetical protein BSK21_05590 [Marivivens sp. JLT3646]OBR37645.1 hypothetical protein A9199_03275 [Donghicola sp. JL3646]
MDILELLSKADSEHELIKVGIDPGEHYDNIAAMFAHATGADMSAIWLVLKGEQLLIGSHNTPSPLPEPPFLHRDLGGKVFYESISDEQAAVIKYPLINGELASMRSGYYLDITYKKQKVGYVAMAFETRVGEPSPEMVDTLFSLRDLTISVLQGRANARKMLGEMQAVVKR